MTAPPGGAWWECLRDMQKVVKSSLIKIQVTALYVIIRDSSFSFRQSPRFQSEGNSSLLCAHWCLMGDWDGRLGSRQESRDWYKPYTLFCACVFWGHPEFCAGSPDVRLTLNCTKRTPERMRKSLERKKVVLNALHCGMPAQQKCCTARLRGVTTLWQYCAVQCK